MFGEIEQSFCESCLEKYKYYVGQRRLQNNSPNIILNQKESNDAYAFNIYIGNVGKSGKPVHPR